MRRQRDIDGNNTFFDPDNVGSGFFSNIASKLASETTKKIAKNAAENIIKKGSEKLGEKMMESGLKKVFTKKENKIEDKVFTKKENKSDIITTTEIAGNKIVKLLQEYNKKEQIEQPINKYADISQKFDELLLS